MPRIPSTASCRRPARSWRWNCRTTSASIRGVEAGGEVTPYYDRDDRQAHRACADAARRRSTGLRQALDRTVIAGVRSNVAFPRQSMPRRRVPARQGRYRLYRPQSRDARRRAAASATTRPPRLASRICSTPRLRAKPEAATAERHRSLAVGRRRRLSARRRALDRDPDRDRWRECRCHRHLRERRRSGCGGWCRAGDDAKVFAAGHDAYVVRGGRQTRVRIRDFAAPSASASAGDGVIKAPMHGKVLELLAAVGDRVAFGQRLAVIEAMKMEHTLRAPFAGIVTQVPVRTGCTSCGRRAGHGARAGPGASDKVGSCRFISSSFASVPNSVRDLEDWIKQKLKAQAQEPAKSPSTSTAPAWCPSAPPNSPTAVRSIG